MTKEEFAAFAMAVRTFYPREKILPNKEAMELWFRELTDIPYDVAEAVLRKWVSLNKWSPSIADIREMVAEVQNGEMPDYGAAWESVLRAIRQYGFYNQQAALESLDPMTRGVVERMGFRELCMSENPGVDRGQFRKIYETVAMREKKKQQVALPLQGMLEQLSGAKTLQLGSHDAEARRIADNVARLVDAKRGDGYIDI